MTRISDMTPLLTIPSTGAFVPVEKPGSPTNYRYDLGNIPTSDGLFASADNLSVPVGFNMVATTGYASLDVGSAVYVADAAVNAAYVIAHPRSSFISLNARGFRISLEQDITPEMLGALGDGVADDYPAFQAALDLLPAAGGNIAVLAGTYKLLTTPTWGVKDVRWNISPAATFTGAGAALFLSTARPFDAGLRIDLAANVTTAQINVVSSPTSTLFARPSINVSDGTLLKSSTPDFLTLKPLEIAASTILLEPSEKVQINPTPLSYALGFAVVQSTPASGSQAGPFFANTIDFTARSTLTGTGLPGGASSATFGGFRVSVNAGGANFGCVSVMGGSVGVTQTVADTSTGDKNGFSSGVSISASTLGKLYGSSSAWTVLSGGVAPAAIGHETDLTISGTGSVDHAIGFNAWKGGTGSGAVNDAAYAIGISGAVGAAKWKVGHLLYTQSGVTASPVDSGFSWFASDHTTTVGNVFNCANVTVSGNILNFPHAVLTGAGSLTIDGNLICVPGASVTPTVNGQMTVQATSNTSLTFKLKGSDGTVRTASLTLA